MSKEIRVRIFALVSLLVLGVSVVFTTPARADGGTPTPVSTPTTTTTDLSQVPSGTSVVVVDSGGHKVPLGTQKAAEILLTGDPVWCPSSVTNPVPGSYGCTDPGAGNSNYDPTSLASLMSYLSSLSPQKAVSGTIWITGSADNSAGPATLDGSTLTTMANYSLTLKGGWTGVGTHIDSNNPSTFTQPINIINWNANVTLSDIQVDGAAASGQALNISTKKSISLTNVHADGNTSGGGAALDTCLSNGTKCLGGGSVTITSSEFNGNAGPGLNVTANGAITLNSVVANSNTAGGALGVNLDNCIFSTKCLGVGNVSVTNGTFTGNNADGLDVTSNGSIIVNTITASGSTAASGASLNNSSASTIVPVTVAGTNVFNGNSVSGLVVESNGVITANNLTATGNNTSHTTGVGVWFQNDFIASNTAGVTLTTSSSSVFNTFTGNYGNGLRVNTRGAIKANNLTADSSTTGGGVLLNNSTASLAQPVTLTGTNEFSGNSLTGLIIYSRGAITTYNLTADSNGTGDATGAGDGVYLDNCNDTGSGCTTPTIQPVTLLGSNTFNGNYNDGLNVQSRGAITTYNLSAAANGSLTSTSGTGVWLENDSTAVLPVYVRTSSISVFNAFSGNYDYGLVVKSNGAISANNLQADASVNTTANFGFGAFLDNCLYSSGCTASSAQPVTLTGSNEFGGNASSGLVIQSRGAITTNNITAQGNGMSASSGVGALLSNNFNTTYGVTVSGTNIFNGNYGITVAGPAYLGGLAVFSNGPITASNLSANSNSHGSGVYLNNSNSGSSSKSITLTGTNIFNSNGYLGLDAESFGSILTNNLNAAGNGTTATANYGTGALLKNNFTTGTVLSTGTVTLTGTNLFSGNYGLGLNVLSNGAIKANNVSAVSTVSGGGASLDNSSAPSAQPVTLTGGAAFNKNAGTGLSVKTKGAITLSSLTADANSSGDGVFLQNDFTGFASSIVLGGADYFRNNYNNGLVAYSFGTITLNTTSLTATGNGIAGSAGDGVYLDNCIFSSGCTAPLVKSITVKGTNTFDGNYTSGLVMYSEGSLTANNVTSSNNQHGWGVSLYNSTAAPISLTGSNVFYSNGHDGVTITSSGAITLNNVIANNNGQLAGGGGYYGVWIDNTWASSAQSVTLNGTNVFNGNYTGGMYIHSKGAIKANNVTASNSLNGPGATLDNSAGPSTSGVTFTGSNFFVNNFGDGLLIITHGAVSLTSITADDNQNGGDGLNVTTTGTFTLMCGSFMNNTGYGINTSTTGAAAFTGAVLLGNTSGDLINHTGAGTVTIKPLCPLP